jgi:hypothetical protein
MAEQHTADGTTLISLPNGVSVPVAMLASRGVPGFEKQPDGSYTIPGTAYVRSLAGPTRVEEHPDWFPVYTANRPPELTPDPQMAGTAVGLLREYGLEELLPYVDKIARGELTMPELLNQLYDTSTEPGKVVDRLFPEIRMLREGGKEPISIDQIQQLRFQYRQAFREIDAPEGFYDSVEDFTQLIVGQKSPEELRAELGEWRLVADEVAADPSNATTLAELNRLYGITPDSGAFLSYVINPERGIAAVKQQISSARLSATASRTGFGELERGEAEILAARGVNDQQARAGFSELARSRELLDALPGEQDSVGRDEQMAAVFEGDASALQKIERRRGQRVGEFQGGGRAAASRSGTTGLISS